MPMSDTLRDRIAVALRGHGPMGAYYRDGLEFCSCGAETDGLLEFEAHLADAVIRELPELTALRRCGRCRIPCLPHEYPPMSEGSNELRPFCIPCTEYIEWATS